jgi:hypothetical protein
MQAETIPNPHLANGITWLLTQEENNFIDDEGTWSYQIRHNNIYEPDAEAAFDNMLVWIRNAPFCKGYCSSFI